MFRVPATALAARSETGCTTEQVTAPDDALRLRCAARERGADVSAYLAQLIDAPDSELRARRFRVGRDFEMEL